MKSKYFLIVLVFSFMFFAGSALASIINPSMLYCEELGYETETSMTDQGEIGICKFPDGTNCEAWNFLKGECGTEHSYCILQGYEIKTITDEDKCSSIFSDDCAVCVLTNGTETEVTKLMELSFSAGYCGDGICDVGEDHGNCPQDCPSGKYDFYCDGLEDEICDPDCDQDSDPDCKSGMDLNKMLIILAVIFGLIAIILIVYKMKNKQIQQIPQQTSY